MSPDLHALVARTQRRLVLVWGAFLAATVFYAIIGVLIARQTAAAAPAGVSSLPFVVGVATCGLAVAGAGAAVGRRLLTQALRGRSIGGAPLPPPPPPATKLADDERELARRLPTYQSVMIITWASYEAAAVVGLVLSIILRDPVPAGLGSVVALVLLAANRPQAGPFLAECDRWRRLHRRPGDDQ